MDYTFGNKFEMLFGDVKKKWDRCSRFHLAKHCSWERRASKMRLAVALHFCKEVSVKVASPPILFLSRKINVSVTQDDGHWRARPQRHRFPRVLSVGCTRLS